MKDKLLDELSETPQTKNNDYFITRYNEVIAVYNNSLGANEQELTFLDENKSFEKITAILNKPLVKILMVLVFVFVPLINLALLGFLFFFYLFLLREGKKHKQNIQKVANPL